MHRFPAPARRVFAVGDSAITAALATYLLTTHHVPEPATAALVLVIAANGFLRAARIPTDTDTRKATSR